MSIQSSSLPTTLKDLPLHDIQVNPKTLGAIVENMFEQNPDLPGVMIATPSRIGGVISRRRFHERMSKGYGQEIFLKRPIQVFLDIIENPTFLKLPDTEQIERAMQIALRRHGEDLYEPIVVVQEETNPLTQEQQTHYSLLDFHSLLVAQSRILAQSNAKIKRQAYRLHQERQKAREYADLLEHQKVEIQKRNQLLENQKASLMRQSREISEFNQRFMQIGKLLSEEGKKAFQATFEGVNVICRNTGQVVHHGKLLQDDLKRVRSLSGLIEKVSNQVRHLAIQAAIVVNNASGEMGGFSMVTADISKLGSQILEAGSQVDTIARQFENRIDGLTESAHAGTTAARSLIQEIGQAQLALNELERLVNFKANEIHTQLDMDGEDSEQNNTHSLENRIALLESTLIELQQSSSPSSKAHASIRRG